MKLTITIFFTTNSNQSSWHSSLETERVGILLWLLNGRVVCLILRCLIDWNVTWLITSQNVNWLIDWNITWLIGRNITWPIVSQNVNWLIDWNLMRLVYLSVTLLILHGMHLRTIHTRLDKGLCLMNGRESLSKICSSLPISLSIGLSCNLRICMLPSSQFPCLPKGMPVDLANLGPDNILPQVNLIQSDSLWMIPFIHNNFPRIFKSNILSDSISKLFRKLSLLTSIFNHIDDIPHELNLLKLNIFWPVLVCLINTSST